MEQQPWRLRVSARSDVLIHFGIDKTKEIGVSQVAETCGETR
ncbi:MAG TPA: hypothetical protein VK854_04050 [Woeseiaceae bacterium]|nr:hypothetical protein [Woeseiaceae bacterium]